LPILIAAADGSFPPVDGSVTYLPAHDDGLESIVSFTGHAYVSSRLGSEHLADLKPDGLGAVLNPEVQLRMAGPEGSIGVIDVTMVARGMGGGTLPRRHDIDDHPRVRYARSLRRSVAVYGSNEGLVTIGLGLAGRNEMSIETSGDGAQGRALIHEALKLRPPGEPLFAAVSPGNARSLRAFLACGFTPIGSSSVPSESEPLGATCVQ
jgi:hypothetical protein